MLFMPFHVLGIWLRGLFSLVLLCAGLYLLGRWYNAQEIVIPVQTDVSRDRPREEPGWRPRHTDALVDAGEPRVRQVRWELGFNRQTAFLVLGLALVSWSLGVGWLFSPYLRRRPENDEATRERTGTVHRLRRPDGSELHVEVSGPEGSVPLIFLHGWSLDHGEWCYARRELSRRHRLIVWDLRGLGKSDRPANRDWSLEAMARDLDLVLGLAGGRPAVLVGHSIGGMIILTYCKLFLEGLGRRLLGVVLAHTTYTNPVRTTYRSKLYTALQKPVLEPLCHLMVWLAPLVRMLNWLTYFNGQAHRSTEKGSFSGRETRGQLDFITRYYCKAPPDVVGRGMLGMFRYDATGVLSTIPVPTLVVMGEQDKVCLPEASEYMARTIPGARLLNLVEARHCGLFEFHQQFHSALEEFLLRCNAPPQVAALVENQSRASRAE